MSLRLRTRWRLPFEAPFVHVPIPRQVLVTSRLETCGDHGRCVTLDAHCDAAKRYTSRCIELMQPCGVRVHTLVWASGHNCKLRPWKLKVSWIMATKEVDLKHRLCDRKLSSSCNKKESCRTRSKAVTANTRELPRLPLRESFGDNTEMWHKERKSALSYPATNAGGI